MPTLGSSGGDTIPGNRHGPRLVLVQTVLTGVILTQATLLGKSLARWRALDSARVRRIKTRLEANHER